MKKTSKLTLILMLLVMVWPVLVSAQEEKPAQNMQFVIEKVRADKQLFVAENMALTEAEGKLFWPVYSRYQEELFLLRARTIGLIDSYSKVYKQMKDEDAKKLLDELMVIESLGPKLRQFYLPEFQKALPDIKVLRYYQIENKINSGLMYQISAQIPLTQ